MKRYRRFGYGIAVLLISIVITTQYSVIREWMGVGERSEKEAKRPNDWFYFQRAYPKKQMDFRAWLAAQEQAGFFREHLSLEGNYWEEAGPTNIGGRITAVAVHPGQPQKIWMGAADGGVWKSSNGGVEWSPVFDFAPSLSIGALAVDPNDPNTVYVGTGEANASGDSYPGNGIYRTTDGGITWQYLGLPESYYIGRIAVNPQNSQNIFVAATGLLFGKNDDRGIYRTTDGGTTWEKVLFLSDSTAGIDVVIDPLNPANVYAAMWERIRRPWERKVGGMTSGIYKSTDGGTNWMQLTNGLPPNSPTIGRIGLAIAPSNPSVLYAIYADHPGYFLGLFKTTNGGQSWVQTNDAALGFIFNSYGWYFGQVYVDPSNPNTVYALGVDLYKSVNGGSSWYSIASFIHVDHHAIWVDPANSSRIILGNDGGLFISQNGGSNFQKIYNLPITQFYAATADFNNPDQLYGGTQDNGTIRTLTGQVNDWEAIYWGDGFYVIVDPQNSNVIYAEYQYGGLGKSTNGGYSFSSATTGINSNDRRNWMVPVVMDPNNHNTLYYGTYRLYRTTNGAGYWSAISPDLSNGPYSGGLNFGTITTIAVAPTNSSVIYAGTDDSNVWVTTNTGGNWTKISNALPNRWVTRVAVHPLDENIALVTYSGYKYNDYIGYIYKTTDKGQSWTDITHNLPQAPCNVVVIDPDYPEVYYVGTDVGVYVSLDGGLNWQMLGSNLPNSVVMDLVFHQPTRTLIAATHGRSMHKIDVTDITRLPDYSGRTVANDFQLSQNFPNPFNSQTNFGFYSPVQTRLWVSVYDLLGRKVKTLFRGEVNPGWHRLNWDGCDEGGIPAASGTYFLRIQTPERQLTRKMVLSR